MGAAALIAALAVLLSSFAASAPGWTVTSASASSQGDGQVRSVVTLPSGPETGPAAPAAIAAPAATTTPARRALILSTSVKAKSSPDGKSSIEAYEAKLNGFKTVNVNAAKWDSMTAAQFAQYQVLIIGDKDCPDTSGSASPAFAAAQANENVWEPVVMRSGGNRVLIGTDPTFHYLGGRPGDKVIGGGIAYAGQVPKATGAYVDLSCSYSVALVGTQVPLLNGLSSAGEGQFTVGGAPCAGAIAIVAQSGPTSKVSDADLSNWECSVHEFFTHWGSDYVPLSIATDPTVPVTYSARDVSTGATASGSPYILVSSNGVKTNSQIRLLPPGASPSHPAATALIGSSIKLIGTITKIGTTTGVPHQHVSFTVASGPNAHTSGVGTTNAKGQTPFSYKGAHGGGTDVDSASYTDNTGALQQATATVTWFAPTCPRVTGGAFLKLLAAGTCAIKPEVQIAECAVPAPPLLKATSPAALNLYQILVKDKLYKTVQIAHTQFIKYKHIADLVQALPTILQPLTTAQKLEVGRAFAAIAGLGPCFNLLEAVVPG